MKNIIYVRLDFENTESIIVPIMYISNILFDVVVDTAYKRIHSGVILEKYKKVQKGTIDINLAFKNDMSEQPFLYDQEVSAYSRILKYNDLVQIVIKYNDYSCDIYQVAWNSDNNDINEYQRNIEYTDKLRIAIDEMED